MEKITVKNLIDFQRKSERSKKTFANNLKKVKEKKTESGGGNYWVFCLSSIGNTFKYNDIGYIERKIDELNEKIKNEDRKMTKNQYQRNADILTNFLEFDFEHLKPSSDLKILTKPTTKSIIDIKGLPIQARPTHVFSFTENGMKQIGAVWFVATIGGYKKSELAVFADMNFRYLVEHYSENFKINMDYCIAIDAFKAQEVNYTSVENGNIAQIMDSIIDEIKTY